MKLFMKYLITTTIIFFLIAWPTQANLIFDLTYDSANSTSNNDDADGKASGSFMIDVAAGQSFGSSNLLALNITVETTNTKIQKYLTPLLTTSFEGLVSEDGLTVSFTDIFLKNGSTGFGCNMLKCENGGIIQTIGNDTSGEQRITKITTNDLFKYDTQEEIRSSLVVSLKNQTNISIPEPSTIVIFVLAMVGVLSCCLKKHVNTALRL